MSNDARQATPLDLDQIEQWLDGGMYHNREDWGGTEFSCAEPCIEALVAEVRRLRACADALAPSPEKEEECSELLDVLRCSLCDRRILDRGDVACVDCVKFAHKPRADALAPPEPPKTEQERRQRLAVTTWKGIYGEDYEPTEQQIDAMLSAFKDLMAPPRADALHETPAEAARLTEDAIQQMVNRFLSWRLPENFNPDGGISFKREFNEHTPHPMKHEPTGTNLFDSTQAEAMVRHMLGAAALDAPRTDNVERIARAAYLKGYALGKSGIGPDHRGWELDRAELLCPSKEKK